MSYRNERFARSTLSLDQKIAEGGIDKERSPFFSDGNLGVERMIGAIDYDRAREDREEKRREKTRAEKMFEAEMRLAEAGKGYLINVLLLIVENGRNRELSLKCVKRRTYFLHRNQLLDFFCCTPLHMD